MPALAINSVLQRRKDWPWSPKKTKPPPKDLLGLIPAVEAMLAVATGGALGRPRLAMTASRRLQRIWNPYGIVCKGYIRYMSDIFQPLTYARYTPGIYLHAKSYDFIGFMHISIA
jgi:hypothetical protein